MKQYKETHKLGWWVAMVGALILLTPLILPVCEGMLELVNGKQVPMRCHWTAHAEMLMGGVVIVVGVMLAFAKERETYRRLSNLVSILGVFVALIPLYIIPTCMNPEMSCNIGTKPALLILAGLAFILGIVGSRPEKAAVQP